MSFVSEPYAEIVDSLLTQLTGGSSYEEFVYNPEKKGYVFSSTADPSQIKIFGSYKLEYHKFIPLQDYEPRPDGIFWLDGQEVIKPDEGTRFFANYYPSARDIKTNLSDRNVGSVTRLLAESFGIEFALFSKRLDNVYRSGFVDTAEGRSLEQVVSILGVERKSAEFATGVVDFKRDTPVPADIVIPVDYLVSTTTEPVKSFETTSQRVLRKGQLGISVPIRSLTKGEDGLTQTDTIILMNQPLLGIDRITNPNDTTFGTAPETDEQLCSRAKSQLERSGKTTLNALKYALLAIRAQSGTDQVSQVTEKDIKIEEDFTNGPGLVRILLDADQNNADLVTQVNQAVFETRAAGVLVVHNLSQPDTGGGGVPGDGGEDVPLNDQEKPIVKLKKTIVSLDLMVSLQSEFSVEGSREQVKRDVVIAINQTFKDLAIGQKLQINRLINRVLNVEGVDDVIQLSWNATPPLGESFNGTRLDIQVPKDQKIILSGDPNGVNVRIAGAMVRMDFFIETTIGGTESIAQSQVENEIESKLTIFFDSNNGEINLDSLENALAGNGYTIRKMAVNVEYTENGLIVRDIQSVSRIVEIKDNETPVIRLVQIKVVGGVIGA